MMFVSPGMASVKPRGRGRLSINLSYSGKVARELSLASGRPACTIRSFEKANPASKFALQRQNGEPPMVVVRREKILMFLGLQQQVVIRVDEAGLLGARQTEQAHRSGPGTPEDEVQVKLHLLGDAKQMQGIQAGNLLGPQQKLEVRGESDFARLTDIMRQRDPWLLEIARGLNRADRPLAETERRALRPLEGRQEVVEIANRVQLRGALVRHYIEESPKALAGTEADRGGRTAAGAPCHHHAARSELNGEIRSERVSIGEIARGLRIVC